MYFGTDTKETVSVMGTPAFMEFVESIQTEGVSFEHVPMGGGTTRQDSLIVEVDTENPDKNLDDLDIPLPKLTRRFQRDFKDLDALDPAALGNKQLPLKPFTPEETREIVFKTMLDSEIHHTIQLDGSGPADFRSVVAFFARQLLKDLRLVGGYDVLYGKVKIFMREQLFTSSPVNLEDPVVLRNLSEPEVGKVLYDAFKTAINALTIQDSGTTRIEARIRLRETRPFRTEHRPFLAAKKSIFTKTVGEVAVASGFELSFAAFLETATGCRGICQELSGSWLQARLCKSRRGPLHLHAGLHRPHHRRHGLGRRDQGPQRSWTCRRKWRGSSCGVPTRRLPKRTDGGTTSSSWIN
jgi:type III restriction enzyme